MQLVIGTDHRGFALKEELKKAINEISWLDVGSYDDQPIDYPLIAHKAAQMVSSHVISQGVLFCGSGIGMSIVANRYPGVRAALVWSPAVARQAKEHDNANMIILPANYISVSDALNIFYAWHRAPFLGGKYQKRVEEIDQLLNSD